MLASRPDAWSEMRTYAEKNVRKTKREQTDFECGRFKLRLSGKCTFP